MGFYFNTNSISPSRGGSGRGSDGFAETFGENIYHLSDDRDSNGLIPFFTVNDTEQVFSGITNLPAYWLPNAYFNNNKITKASFPDLIKLSAYNSANNLFSGCTSLISVEFPELIAIYGYCVLQAFLLGCTAMTSISFPKLSIIYGTKVFGTACSNSTLSDIYFPALTTSSFGPNTDQFDTMMRSTGNTIIRTLHFPSNLESTIQGLTGYPLFGGTSDYVVLSFDLPATS